MTPTATPIHLLVDLESRGLLAQATDPQLDAKLTALAGKGPIAAYVGFDPTADSLHVGHFLGIRALMLAQRCGIRPIALVGGATGLIGDPSFRSSERPLLTKEIVAQNVRGIQRLLERFLDFNHPSAPAAIVNNLDWFGAMSAIDFLRDVGKFFRIGSMLAKDSVKARMEEGEEGMSYTEFSYQLLQGFDFHRLYKDHGVILQMGGSDQWGNITAGIDLIRKAEGEAGHAFAVTFPLITDSQGRKFGKSEGNAVWLTADKTSAYDFYQFWLRVEDADAERYLKFFTFLPLQEIEALSAQLKAEPEKRAAQRRLAEVMTELVHGKAALEQAQGAASIMYGGAINKDVTEATLAAVFAQVPTADVPAEKINQGWPAPDALADTGLAKSKGEARRLIAQGGFYVNNEPWKDANLPLTTGQLIAGNTIVLRTGKKNYRLVRVVG
jgi:tyrosyl-tRNA synthetase